MKKITIIIFILVFTSCKKDTTKKDVVTGNFQIDRFLKEYVSTSNTKGDSIYLKDLDVALSLNNKKDKYQYSVEKYGNLFDSKYKYIQIIDSNNYECTVYIIKNKEVIKLISFEKKIPFNKIFTRDINNDGQKDFVITSPTTGPEEFHICLLDKNTGLISNEINTYNYYPVKNNEFIEVVNHQSPIVHVFKMRWQGIKVDTIEKIYYDWEHPVYYKADKYPFKDFGDQDKSYVYDSTVKVKIIKKLPSEYIKAVKKYYPELIKY
ncbi:hypothetical protein [Flavobacterium piscisymbiosum]|uniref:Lipoprotein n=1 Tax=Flavobacterium piscisymbiosum TaxID=2893753 RepID=A0ABS8MHD7_9FLAO|nr:hypothetical protein [Flavobacterium sp. F-30]MCC9064130.1 hypothetical protein [Flavobacterium sp. F-30]